MSAKGKERLQICISNVRLFQTLWSSKARARPSSQPPRGGGVLLPGLLPGEARPAVFESFLSCQNTLTLQDGILAEIAQGYSAASIMLRQSRPEKSRGALTPFTNHGKSTPSPNIYRGCDAMSWNGLSADTCEQKQTPLTLHPLPENLPPSEGER